MSIFKSIFAVSLAVSTIAGSSVHALAAASADQKKACQAAFGENEAEIKKRISTGKAGEIPGILEKGGCAAAGITISCSWTWSPASLDCEVDLR